MQQTPSVHYIHLFIISKWGEGGRSIAIVRWSDIIFFKEKQTQ